MQLVKCFFKNKNTNKTTSQQKGTLWNVLVIQKMSETISKSLKSTQTHPPSHVFI